MGNQPLNQFQYGSFREDKPAKPGHSRELICMQNKDDPEFLTQPVYHGCKTLWELLQEAARKYSSLRFIGARNNDKEGRPYEFKTHREIYDLMDLFARGAQYLNLTPSIEAEDQQWNFMGIFAKNREEWVVVDLACLRSAVTIVPFFDSLGSEALSFVINQTELTTMCIENKSLDLLIKLKQTLCPTLQNIVLFDTVDDKQREEARAAGLNLYLYTEVIEIGKEHPEIILKDPTPEDIYMFCYTSGTTGDPKGSKISHSGFLAALTGHDHCQMHVTSNDLSLSYLPYAHIFEQTALMQSIAQGNAHGYYSGDPLKLFDDMQALKPTLLATVPRILNRVHAKVMEGVSQAPALKKWIFHKALDTKTQQLMNKGIFSHGFYDKAVFQKVKDLFGGQIRILITASAPISGEVLTFFKVALGIHIYEVYGQTETCGPATVTLPKDPTSGHVGGLFPAMKIRLRDVVEMGYLATDDPPKGEICFKGTNMFRGYFKSLDKTREAMDEDGWICSGDVGIVYPNGSIKVVDRAKNIFKLSQGEYIAPEKLENIYCQCPFVSQIFVYGDSIQSYILAVIVPDLEQVKKWATVKGVDASDVTELMNNEELKKTIIAIMDSKAKEYSLNSLEKIRKIHLSPEQFTVQNDLITPTFKIKRNIAKKTFQAQIDKMYAEPL